MVGIVADLLGVTREEEKTGEDAVDHRTPRDDITWKENLAWLWSEICLLRPNQRCAFLLHLDDIREFDLHGIATVRTIAFALGIPAEDFASLWNKLPLDDKAIALRLGANRQQVINARKNARGRLGKALEIFLTAKK